MNKQPVHYLQTDARWKDKPYYSTGSYNTIGASGCGPTSAAMILTTMLGKEITPIDTCKWAVDNGHRTKDQGTAFSYLPAQFAAYGIDCKILSWTNAYGNKNAAVHTEAFKLLKDGYYLIACMGPGNWTTGGHFIVIWWEDGKVRINDSNSTKDIRLNGDLNTFKSQVKYYWAIDAREFNKKYSATLSASATDKKKETIKSIQSALNTKYNFGLAVDGSWGPASKKAMIKAVQTEINRLYGSTLVIDGSFGPASQRACPGVKKGTKNNLAWLIQACLVLKGYNLELDGSFGPATDAAVRAFQKANGLTVDGSCGPATFVKLLG